MRKKILLILLPILVLAGIVLSSCARHDAKQAVKPAESSKQKTEKAINLQSTYKEVPLIPSLRLAKPDGVIVKGAWGKEDGEFGVLLPGRDKVSEPQYPYSFDVDSEGKIYILDEFNKRVQIFDKSGNFLSAFPVQSGDSIKVDGDSIYITDDRGEAVVYQDGKLIKKGQASSIVPKNLCDLSSNIPLGTSQTSVKLSKTEKGITLDILNKDGSSKSQVFLKRQEASSLDDKWGVDKDGNVYVIAGIVNNGEGNAKEPRYAVVKYISKKGDIHKIDIPGGNSHTSFIIHESGVIYELEILKDGLQIIKWRVP
ncbi:MAG: hypothetical protein K6T91_07270 [Firmicutes bacterium]|nr:hypothetical protein [Bacillota bacterium]